VISPELADVLSTIICRVRTEHGAVPLVAAYDYHERVWNPPMPLLFQCHFGGERRPIAGPAVRELISNALTGSGITDASGKPLRFSPHDFRRILITDAIMHGMPPPIAQLVAGHRDINVTMGYKAVYPEEVINGHRAFIARRRALRPSEEYRTPTDQEWEEFLGHFERRKVSLGTCGRSYATPCIHEHSCIRCPLARTDPAHVAASPRSATTSSAASPKPAARDGSVKSRTENQPRRRARQAHPTRRTHLPTRGRPARHAQHQQGAPVTRPPATTGAAQRPTS